LQRDAVPLAFVRFKSWDHKSIARTIASDLCDGKRLDARDDELTLIGMPEENLLERGAAGGRFDFVS
jgi:hypothetical protein